MCGFVRGDPPLEAKKVLFSLFASLPGLFLDFTDVVRAYFHAKARIRVYVDLPEEDRRDGVSGRLSQVVYGTTDAALNWELGCSEMMIEAGFTQGHTARTCSTASRMVFVQSYVETILQCSDQGVD